jgi:hypothetical protein
MITKLSIRQPDSKIIRGEFPAENTLSDIRKWIDINRTDTSGGSNSSPYVLQTTFPTRTFEVAEEESETVGSIFGKGGQCIMKVPPQSPPRFVDRGANALNRRLNPSQKLIHLVHQA